MDCGLKNNLRCPALLTCLVNLRAQRVNKPAAHFQPCAFVVVDFAQRNRDAVDLFFALTKFVPYTAR